MIVVALLLASAPTAEAEQLGRRLAQTGALATMLPVMTRKETEELVSAHPELTAREQASLRATGADVAAAGIQRVTRALGEQYAATLSLPDLRSLVAFNESPVAERYRAVVPTVTMKAFASLGPIDFKGDVTKAFCAKEKKLCP